MRLRCMLALSLVLAVVTVSDGSVARASTVSPAALCSGLGPSLFAGLGVKRCGVPENFGTRPHGVAVCTWTSPPQIYETVVSAGSFTCASTKSCLFRPIPHLSGDWIGRTVIPTSGRCADGRIVQVELVRVWLANRDGSGCGPVRPDLPLLRGFELPARWGGRLTVIWSLTSVSKTGVPIGHELEAASFALTGRANGCPLLTSTSSPA